MFVVWEREREREKREGGLGRLAVKVPAKYNERLTVLSLPNVVTLLLTPSHTDELHRPSCCYRSLALPMPTRSIDCFPSF